MRRGGRTEIRCGRLFAYFPYWARAQLTSAGMVAAPSGMVLPGFFESRTALTRGW